MTAVSTPIQNMEHTKHRYPEHISEEQSYVKRHTTQMETNVFTSMSMKFIRMYSWESEVNEKVYGYKIHVRMFLMVDVMCERI
jgi:hypothetical protein